MPHAKILGTKQTVHTLAQLHAELGGKLQANKNLGERLARDMQHVEAVIKMLQPTFNLVQITARRRYKVNPHFKRGECFRSALDVLRTAEVPLTSREIAMRMLHKRGVKNPSRDLIYETIGAVHASLQNHKTKAVTAHEDKTPMRWTIIA